MWRLTLAYGVLYLMSAEYSSNVWGLAWNLRYLTVALSLYDILLCSETFVSDMCRVSELLVPVFGSPVLCWGKMPRARGMTAYIRDGCGAICQPKFKCGCCEMLVFMVCGVTQNLYLYSLIATLTLMT